MFADHPSLGLVCAKILVGPEQRIDSVSELMAASPLPRDLATGGWAMSYVKDVVVHHHPSPSRQSPSRRQYGIARAATLAALMRLPWRDAVGELRWVAARSPSHRSGVLRGLLEAPAAFRRRRPLPDEVLALRRLLSRW